MSVRVPRVRVVVLNYDGGDMTMRCLRALEAVEWPREALEILLVDNASIDGLARRIERELPDIRVLEHTHNVGFAGGCNLGLEDLDSVDYVALLNNDAVPARTGCHHLSTRSRQMQVSARRAPRWCLRRRSSRWRSTAT